MKKLPDDSERRKRLLAAMVSLARLPVEKRKEIVRNEMLKRGLIPSDNLKPGFPLPTSEEDLRLARQAEKDAVSAWEAMGPGEISWQQLTTRQRARWRVAVGAGKASADAASKIVNDDGRTR